MLIRQIHSGSVYFTDASLTIYSLHIKWGHWYLHLLCANIFFLKDNLNQCGIRPFCVKCLCLWWLSRTEGAEMQPFLQETSSLPPFHMCRVHTQGCQGRERMSPLRVQHVVWATPVPGIPLPSTSRWWRWWHRADLGDAVWSVCAP